MANGGGGSIVNISSGGAGHESTPFMPPGYVTYAVAKAAMERFSTALAPELVDLGIAINALAAGCGQDGAVGARARRGSRLERLGQTCGCRARSRLPRRTDRRDLHRPGRRLDAVRIRLALSRVYNGRAPTAPLLNVRGSADDCHYRLRQVGSNDARTVWSRRSGSRSPARNGCRRPCAPNDGPARSTRPSSAPHRCSHRAKCSWRSTCRCPRTACH